MTDLTPTLRALAREIIDGIPSELGMTPDPWPSDRELDAGRSFVLRFVENKLAAAHASLLQEMETYLHHKAGCNLEGMDEAAVARYRARSVERDDCTCGLESKLALLRRSAHAESTEDE